MTSIQILKDAEADLAALAGLPGEIRAKVKAGIAEMSRLRDAIDATIAAMTGGARDILASLRALATAEAAAPVDAAGPPSGGADAPAADPAASAVLATSPAGGPASPSPGSFGG